MRIQALLSMSVLGLAGLGLVQAQVADTPGASNLRDAQDSRIIVPKSNDRLGESDGSLHRSIWLSELEGIKVRDSSSQEIGTVDDVLMDLSRGSTPYVIVNTRSGFFGLGGKSAAIPSEHFQRIPEQNYLQVNLAKDRLASFPQTDGRSKDKEAWNQLTREYRQTLGLQDPVRSSIVDAARSVVMLLRGDDVINKDIFSSGNERLGQVRDFLVQLDKGQALLATVEPVGSDKRIAIPPLLFLKTPSSENLLVNTTAEVLSSVPSIDYTARNLAEGLASLYRHFQLQPTAALASMLQETGSALQSASDRAYTRDQSVSDRNRTWETDADVSRDPETRRSDIPGDRTTSSDRSSSYDRSPHRGEAGFPDNSQRDQARGQDRISFPADSQSAERQEWRREEQGVLWSDRMKGEEVRNYQGKTLGRIDDLVIDLDDDNVTHAVLSHGGVLGIGSKHSIVPLSLLRTGENSSVYLIDVSESEMDRAPKLDKDSWRQGGRDRWLESVNSYYREMFPRLQSNRIDNRAQQRTLGYTLLTDFIGKPVQYTDGGLAGEIRDVRVELSQGRLRNLLISPDSDSRYWRSYSVNEITADGPNRFYIQSNRSSNPNSDTQSDTGREPVRHPESDRNR